MKEKRSILAAVVALAIGIAFFILYRHQLQHSRNRLSNGGQVDSTNGATNTMGEPEADKPSKTIEKAVRMIENSETIKDLNTQAINYYGITVDQDGSPVPTVDVHFDIRGGGRAKAVSGDVTSDAAGRFSITGYQGMDVTISPTKAGYRAATTNSGGKFSLLYPASGRYSGNAQSPSIVRMWKLQGPEELVKIDQEFTIPKGQSSSVRIDLLKGKIVETGGDLMIKLVKGEVDEFGSYDWNYVIEPVEGGIIAVPDGEVYNVLAAPTTGWDLRFEREFSNDRTKRLPNDRQEIFLKSRNGQVFSKFILGIRPPTPDQPGYIHLLKGVANPSGSPNWEVDPAKVHLPE